MQTMRRFFLIGLVLPLALALGACASAPRTQAVPEIHFTQSPTLNLDVATIEVVIDYKPPFAGPNVDHLFATPPRNVMARWGEERLRAVGTGGRARFIVLDASVVETGLDTTQGLAGVIRKEQSERYDGRVEGRLEIYDAANTRMAFASAQASQFQTVLEDASPNDRRDAWFELLSAMMETFDREMEAAIRGQLSGVVK